MTLSSRLGLAGLAPVLRRSAHHTVLAFRLVIDLAGSGRVFNLIFCDNFRAESPGRARRIATEAMVID
jgi:hypothetical protein